MFPYTCRMRWTANTRHFTASTRRPARWRRKQTRQSLSTRIVCSARVTLVSLRKRSRSPACSINPRLSTTTTKTIRDRLFSTCAPECSIAPQKFVSISSKRRSRRKKTCSRGSLSLKKWHLASSHRRQCASKTWRMKRYQLCLASTADLGHTSR